MHSPHWRSGLHFQLLIFYVMLLFYRYWSFVVFRFWYGFVSQFEFLMPLWYLPLSVLKYYEVLQFWIALIIALLYKLFKLCNAGADLKILSIIKESFKKTKPVCNPIIVFWMCLCFTAIMPDDSTSPVYIYIILLVYLLYIYLVFLLLKRHIRPLIFIFESFSWYLLRMKTSNKDLWQTPRF